MRSAVTRLRTPTGAALSAAGLVALAGVVLVLLGIAKATVWAPERITVARVAGQPGAPVVTTTAAATALDGPALEVDVRGPAGRPVFVGVGREDDVAAYLGAVARTEVTGVSDGQGVLQRQGAEPSLPQPSGVDVWAESATGSGSASLTWPQGPGRWRVVAAVDGATPPTEVVFTWQRARASSPAPVLVAVGVLLLLLGLVGALAARRARPAAGPAPAPTAVPAAAPAVPAHLSAPSPGAAPTPASVPARAPGRAPDQAPAHAPGHAPAQAPTPPPAAVPARAAAPAGHPVRPVRAGHRAAEAPGGPAPTAAQPAAGAARPAPAPGSRRAARAAATGELPLADPRAAAGRPAPGPWYDDPDESEDDVAPAPFRQPPGGRS